MPLPPAVPPPAARPGRRPAADLIELVVEHMAQNLEPLKYSVLAPSRYLVYMHADEFARLEGVLGIIEQQAIRALNEKLADLNLGPGLSRYAPRFFRASAPPVENPADWHVEFLADADGDLAPGAVLITSELLLPASPELALGSRTKRIATVYSGARSTTREIQTVAADTPALATAQTATAAAAPVAVVPLLAAFPSPPGPSAPGPSTAVPTAPLPPLPVAVAPAPEPTRALARLSYDDDAGTHEYAVVKASVSIGRGGLTYPVDIRIVSSPDVSREHARIRHDAEAGRFCLIDLSTLGTTVNGQPVPRGYDEVDGSKRENGVEIALPDRARIGLANVVFLDFRVER